MNDVDTFFNTQLSLIKENRDRNLIRLENNTDEISKINEKIDLLKTENRELELFINQKVANNQVYRIAAWTTNEESAAKIDRDRVGLVAFIWFGSLAAMIGFMGIFLALAACVILDDRIKENAQTQKSNVGKLITTIRRLLHSRRKSRKIETKIVEVDKVVFKEIPVEVVRKEFVHIPFYTNDKTLLRFSNGEDFEESIKYDDSDKEKTDERAESLHEQSSKG